MTFNRRGLMAIALAAAVATSGVAGAVSARAAGTPELAMDLKDGRVIIQLRPDLAPKAVARLITLTQQGFYNGTPFHRVIDGFMAQGGDPTGTGTGGSSLPNLPAEFSNDASFVTGTVGMARTSDPNTANSQFFICLAPQPSLNGQYTIVGQVISGMNYVNNIKKGDGDNGQVTEPDRIVKMTVLPAGQ
jgi:peptidylprolyl isomerase